MERSKHAAAVPCVVVRDGYIDVGKKRDFRLRACSRMVIAVHAATEALSKS